ncbi:MAG: dUTP diphosphatase [Methanosarcina sp.]|nr:dUTP diphosphatase [Methanosarcina sp.]
MEYVNLSQNPEPLVRSRNSDAGTDIKSNEHVIITPNGGRATVDTGVILLGELGKYCKLAERSGLASKKGILLGGGIIDTEYRGTVKVVMVNTGTEPFEVNIGDKIAQVIIHVYDMAPFIEVAEIAINQTDRGSKGFGSSGV